MSKITNRMIEQSLGFVAGMCTAFLLFYGLYRAFLLTVKLFNKFFNMDFAPEDVFLILFVCGGVLVVVGLLLKNWHDNVAEALARESEEALAQRRRNEFIQWQAEARERENRIQDPLKEKPRPNKIPRYTSVPKKEVNKTGGRFGWLVKK